VSAVALLLESVMVSVELLVETAQQWAKERGAKRQNGPRWY